MNGCFTPFWGPDTHLEWAKLLFTEGPQLSHDTSSCQSPKNKPGYNSPDTPIRFHQGSQITAVKCRLDFFIEFARQHTNEWKLRSGSVNLPQNPIFQSEWDKHLYEARFDLLLHSATSEAERARLLSVSLESASDWLHAIPIPSLGLHLDLMQVHT